MHSEIESARRPMLAWFVLLFATVSAAHADTPSFSKAFVPATIGPGSVSTLVFTLNTRGQAVPAIARDLAFTDNLPAGMTVATPAMASTDCSNGLVSAADGGSSITLSNAQMPANSECHVQVNVTASVPGTYDNLSGDLTSDQGNSGPATASLTVDDIRPGFSKSFSPGMIGIDQIARLSFVIDASAHSNTITNLGFTDTLPQGLQVANPANLVLDCNANATAEPGSSTLSFFGGFLINGGTCTVAVDVLATSAGRKDNLSSGLSSSAGSSGMATASLDVRQGVLAMAFVDDPLAPTSSGTLQFTISNFDRASAMDAITFSDDLDAVLSGLVSVAPLPSLPCGTGSSLSGTSVLTLSGGHLDAGDSCTFSVTVQLPASASAGSYPNSTSTATFDRDGNPQTAASAQDTLVVSPYPLLSKSFIDDPATGGGNVSMEFTITNTDQAFAASDVTFTDNLTDMLPGTTIPSLPANGFCGPGSSASQYLDGFQARNLLVQGASLAPGESCTFTVTLALPADARAGTHANKTSAINATVNSETVTGPGASDSLIIAAAPELSATFTDDPLDAGSSGTLQFTLTSSANAQGDTTAIAFTDDLDAALSGLVATSLPANGFCGAGSQLTGTSALSMTGGSLTAGSSCTFSVTVQVPAGTAPGGYPNTTSSVSATQLGLAVTGMPAEDTLDVSGLTLGKSFTDDPVTAGDTVTLHFELANASGTGNYTNIAFTDNLNNVLSGLQTLGLPMSDICGAGSQISGSSTLTFTGGNLGPGTSCGFDITLQVPPGAGAGEYGNTTSTVSADFAGGPQTLSPASDTLVVHTALSLSKQFTDDPVAPGGNVNLQFTLTNNADQAASALAFSDDLDAALSGLAATGLPQSDVCGAGSQISGSSLITLTGGTLPAGGSCTFQVTVQVPAAPLSTGPVINTTSQLTGMINGTAYSGAPASDSLLIDSASLSKQFAGPIGVGQQVDLSFTLNNLDSSNPINGLGFVDNLSAMLNGALATGLPVSNVCGDGSVLSGTSTLSLSSASLAAGSSCTFTVTIQIPASAVPGDYLNTTSELTSNGLRAAAPAQDLLTIEPPPGFSKSFSPNATGAGIPSTLSLAINNAAAGIAASNLAFTDNLPAGMVVASPSNASSTCGGTLAGAPGSATVSLAGGSVAAGATCGVQVDVVVTGSTGSFVNTTGNLTSSSGNSGTASATLSVLAAPVFAKSFTPATILSGSISTLGFTIDNNSSSQAATGLTFSDNFPAGLTIASPANAASTCGGVFSAAPGSASVSLSGGTVAAGAGCSLQVDVTAATAGSYPNVSGELVSSLGNSGTASDTLTVFPPPMFSKQFVPASIQSEETSTLRFAIDNSSSPQPATGASFNDIFPAGLTIASPSNATNSCGGTLTAAAGGTNVTLSGGNVVAGASCTLQIDVTAAAAGSYPNVSGDLTSSLGNSGPAGATLTVGPPPLPPARNVPTLDSRLLALLVLLLGGVAGWGLRRRHDQHCSASQR